MSFRLDNLWSLQTEAINYDDVVIAAGPSPDWFMSTWNTSNTSTGSSTATQIRLPLVSTGTYNFVVDWGDNTSDTITVWNQAQTTHTYAVAGTYTIRITGTITGWRFVNTGDRLKLLSVQQWGTLRPGNNTAVFQGCTNLKLDNVRGVLDTTGMTSFNLLFQNCLNLVKVNRINEWNTSSITNMGQVFDSCIRFNDNVGNWNTSNVTTLDRMFTHAGAFNNGGSPDINNWDTANVTNLRYTFGTDATVQGVNYMSFNQPIGNWNTSKVTNMSALFFRNPAFNQDIGTKAVTKNNVTYTAWNTSEVTDMSFMFGSGVVAVGVLVPVGSFTNGNSDSIKNWNTSKVTLMNSMFAQQNFFNHDVGTKVVTVNGNTYTAWDVSNVTNMSFMFNAFLNIGNATGVFNNGGSDSIKNWNTSKVTTLQAFCQRQALFNQDVGTKVVTVGANTYTAWDTLNVTNMSSTFSVTSTTTTGSFNNGGSDSIKNWNISKVTTINSIFYGQVLFNQDVSTKRVTVGASTYTAWDTLNVTIMTGPFFINTGTSTGQFNQPIGNWNTSKVTNMQSFAYNQPLFNQDVSTKVITVGPSTYTAWDTLNVTNMSFMFGMVTSILGNFNQNIGNWNTSKVTTISSMFQNQPLFNQDISTKRVTVGASTYTAWDTLNVTNMSFMVSISPGNQGQFNQNIGNWNTSKVTTLASTFTNQPAFNQDISTKTVTVGPSTYTAWNTSEVTSMRFTLYNNLANTASQFNQNIGNWNTSKVTDMNAMLFNTTNFNQNLGTWNVSLVTVFDDVTFGGFAEQSGLSQTNYDALLIGWASRPVLANKAINFGTTKYSSAAVAARVILTSAPNNWTIIDGGQI